MNHVGDENDLLARAVRGDVEAFANLCERHRARLWRIAASVTASCADADDLAQETIVRAFCALASFRAEASFEAWLCRIALNAAHDHQKSAWRRRVLFWRNGSRPEDEVNDLAPSPAEEAERRETQRRVRAAVAALVPRERVPIWLHYFEQFSIADIARLEKVPESTVRSRVQAGLRRLHQRLDDVSQADEDGAATAGTATPRKMKGCLL